ncbi:hypothetical protein WQE_15486 [Paraburkholderia hospita]|uniref:DUF4424 domain-containing protein n=1 Tax=Paraburkholderia hospita TaxID=169430 RepID=A0ABN0FNR0_9BURK|nr:hypothetical protein [Paraburkholderia hospita]EIN00446.1 hypothetical protein WQE_15486 [Paraburkholderia hospita]OUL88454.1 hypothetical protein CA602_11395 [Paraburkholderia hospita]
MMVNRKTRNINRDLVQLQAGERYLVGLPLNAIQPQRLERVGFGAHPANGTRVLPPATGGAASRRNANGFDIIHRDRPMETRYRQISWTWTEHHGRDTVEKTEVKDVPYMRYPRTSIPPYAVELQIQMRPDGTSFVVGGPFIAGTELDAVATNTANVFCEQFGGYEILTEALAGWVAAPVRRVNWELLPPGRNPWLSAKPALDRIVSSAPAGNRGVITARFAAIGAHTPEFVAVGAAGFDGYAVFGFPREGFCLLESRHVNNATYVLSDTSWERVSQLSKAEIISAGAHRQRIIHTRNWFDELELLFAGPARRAA